MLNEIRILSILCCGLAYVGCSPSGGSASKRSAAGDASNAVDLSDQSLSDLRKTYDEHVSLAKNAEQELTINRQISDANCMRIAQLRTECSSSTRLIPDAVAPLGCAQESGVGDTTSSLSATIAGLSAQEDPTAQYILVANKTYTSDPFKVGSDVVLRFKSTGTSDAQLAPQLKQISRIEIRRANEDTTNIAGGAGKAASKLSSGMTLLLKAKGEVMASGLLVDYDDPKFKDFRKLLALTTIQNNAMSPSCRVEQAELDNIASQIRDAQPKITASNSSALSQKQLQDGIKQADAQLAKDTPLLEELQNTLLIQKNELRGNMGMGCHMNETVSEIIFEVSGKKEDEKSIGNFSKVPVPVLNGSASTLSFAMGSSIIANIDQDKYGVVGGSPYVYKVSDQVVVGDIQYLRVSKLGFGYTGRESCTSGFLGATQNCDYQVFEQNIFTINGLKISIKTSGGSTTTIYDNHNLNFTLGSTRYSKMALSSWTESNFTTNDNWIRFIQDTNCDTVK